MSETMMTTDVCACGQCDAKGHAKVVERAMTENEVADILAMREESAARAITEKAEAERVAEIKTSAKAKLVAGEPLTAEEAATIVL
jgi:hypothetical protein